MKRTIRTFPELEALRKFNARRNIRAVIIELPGSYYDDIRKLETEINKSLKACGSEIGAVFVVMGLLAIAVFSAIAPNQYNWTTPIALFGIPSLLGVLALTGKIIGLTIANQRLQRAMIDSNLILREEQLTSEGN